MNDKAWKWEGSPWKTQSAYFAYIRGGIRKGLWNRHPCKIQFLKEHRKRIDNPSIKNAVRFPKVWGAECNICKQIYTVKEIEVDHLKGNHSLQSFDDISTFIEAIVTITPDDLQLVCKECHSIKSLQEKKGITFEEAKIEKMVISITKSKKDKQWLLDRDIPPASNAVKRRKQIKEVLTNELGAI